MSDAVLYVPELGQLAMILALCFAAVQSFFPLVGAWRGDHKWMSLGQPAAWGQFVFLLFAFPVDALKLPKVAIVQSPTQSICGGTGGFSEAFISPCLR